MQSSDLGFNPQLWKHNFFQFVLGWLVIFPCNCIIFVHYYFSFRLNKYKNGKRIDNSRKNQSSEVCASCYEDKCGFAVSLPQLEADKKQLTGSSMLNADELCVGETSKSKRSAPSVNNCGSIVHGQPLRNIMEENIRMRQAMNSVRIHFMTC